MSFTITQYRLKVMFESSLLGTQPQKDVAEEFITKRFEEREVPENQVLEHAGVSIDNLPGHRPGFPEVDGSRIPLNGDGLPLDEVQGLQKDLERGTTAFFRNSESQLCLAGYQLKGAIKEAGESFNGMNNVKNLRNKLNRFVFVLPRMFPIWSADGKPYTAPVSYNGRPLRGQTAQGPRTSLARSEELPAGSWIECQLHVLSISNKAEISEALLRDLLAYWSYMGIGQWRSGDHGQASFELTRLTPAE